MTLADHSLALLSLSGAVLSKLRPLLVLAVEDLQIRFVSFLCLLCSDESRCSLVSWNYRGV